MSSSSPTVSVPPFFWAIAGPEAKIAAAAASTSILPVEIIFVPPRTMNFASLFASLTQAGPPGDSGLVGNRLVDRHEIGMAPAGAADDAGRRVGTDMQAPFGHRGIDRATRQR